MSNATHLKQTARILQEPVVRTFFALALPNLIVAFVQLTANLLDVWLISRLGTHQLAGAALVYPIALMMILVAGGGMGGGVIWAIGYALGVNDREKAAKLIIQSLIIAIILGLFFSALMLSFGENIYSALGGKDSALEFALIYSNLIFGGAVVVWLLNILGSICRATGDMMKLFRVLILVSLIHGSLSSIFVLGLGPIPSLGIRGAALGQIISACIGSLLFLKHLFKPSAPVPIQRPHLRFEWSLIKGILKVGGVSSLSPIQTAGTAIFLTGLVGLFGIPALTGYNIAVRIEFLQLLLLYGFGTALVSTISTNLGAGNPTRARQFGKLGLLVFCIFTGGIGFFSAFFPQYWVAIFTSDPEVLEAGAKYLNMVGPVFVFGGFSTALYFIAQGTGRMLLPVLGGTIRILIIVIGSLVYIRAYQDGVHGVFAVIGVAYFCASVMAFLTTMSFWGWAAKKAAIA